MPRPKPTPDVAKTLKAQGAAIAAGRERNGLTQRQAAEALGVSYSALVKWEVGYRRCPLEVRKQIVKAWKVPREELGIDQKGTGCPCCGRRY